MKEHKETIVTYFAALNMLSLFLMCSAMDGDNVKTPLIIMAVNVICLVISGLIE